MEVTLNHTAIVKLAGFLRGVPTFSIHSTGAISMRIKLLIKDTLCTVTIRNYFLMLKLIEEHKTIREIELTMPFFANVFSSQYPTLQKMLCSDDENIEAIRYVKCDEQVVELKSITRFKEAYLYAVMVFINNNWGDEDYVCTYNIDYGSFFEKLSALHSERYPRKPPLVKRVFQRRYDIGLKMEYF